MLKLAWWKGHKRTNAQRHGGRLTSLEAQESFCSRASRQQRVNWTSSWFRASPWRERWLKLVWGRFQGP